MARDHVRPRLVRILIAAAAAVALAGALLEYPAHGKSAAASTQASSAIAVVPGFKPPPYPGSYGMPALPVNDPQLASYHFTELAPNKVTPAALSSYDTVILYGIRWSGLSASGQAAINAFAATHKVLIWDSDGTGSQNYTTFIHPFSETASGENYKGKPNGAVVSFPSPGNFLASDDPSSPYYLEPSQLVNDRDLINDMNAMNKGAADWVPALVAASQTIPNGGWALAWSYGVIADRTGLTIYSGLDADAFRPDLKPNVAIKELRLQLEAPVRQTPDPSCAPTCTPPPPGGGGSTHASCRFAKPVPKRWVHGRVVLSLKTSVAAGITAQIVTRTGKVVAASPRRGGNVIRLALQTRRLPSNRASRLRALVFVNGKQACSRPLTLRVDNVPPRLLSVKTARGAGGVLLSVRLSERSSVRLKGVRMAARVLPARRTVTLQLPATVGVGLLIVTDRAGNKVVRRLVWR